MVWSSAILSGCCTYNIFINGHQHSKDRQKDLETSRKTHDEADLGMACSYVIFGVRASSPKTILSGRFFIPHRGYERNALCPDLSIVTDLSG